MGAQGDPTQLILHQISQVPFNFRYQANLVGVTDNNGNAISNFGNGLNSNFEYTLVATFPERVVSLTDLGGGAFNALFDVAGPGAWYMYYDSPGSGGNQSNVLPGTGFEDGILAASGTFNYSGLELSSFTFAGSQGIGSFILEGLVDYANPLYLDPALTILDIRAEGTLNQPPLDSTTTGFFDVLGGPLSRYTVNSGQIPDQQFKVDASSKFSVPEPSTMLLLGSGLLGLGAYSRRRIKK